MPHERKNNFKYLQWKKFGAGNCLHNDREMTGKSEMGKNYILKFGVTEACGLGPLERCWGFSIGTEFLKERTCSWRGQQSQRELE
jgi:hypothetical protein